MSEPQRISREAAEDLFRKFLPMFSELERQGVDYCLVGGLAVLAHCLARGASHFRSTHDADAMVSQDYSNADFAGDYLRAYATDPELGDAVYEAVFGRGGIELLGEAENAFVNTSFIGADKNLDGIDTPDFDICRTLNGRTLSSIRRERLEVMGQGLWVATADELIGMKRDTIAIMGVDIRTNRRTQDFIDIDILSGLVDDKTDVPEGDPPPSGPLARFKMLLGGHNGRR